MQGLSKIGSRNKSRDLLVTRGELVSVNYRVVLFSVSVADHISQKIMTCSNSAIQQCYNAAIASNI